MVNKTIDHQGVFNFKPRLIRSILNQKSMYVRILNGNKICFEIAIVTNTGPVAFERTQAFEEVFHQRRISIVKKIMFEENADAKAMQASGYLEELKNSARSDLKNLFF